MWLSFIVIDFILDSGYYFVFFDRCGLYIVSKYLFVDSLKKVLIQRKDIKTRVYFFKGSIKDLEIWKIIMEKLTKIDQ